MTATMTSKVSELEERLGIESLEALHAQRRELVQKSARLRALHGHDGLFDAYRKQFQEALEVDHRARLEKGGTKVTEKMVEAAAYADERYEQVITRGIQDREEWIIVSNELKEIEERIADRTMQMSVFNSEARLR